MFLHCHHENIPLDIIFAPDETLNCYYYNICIALITVRKFTMALHILTCSIHKLKCELIKQLKNYPFSDKAICSGDIFY